MGISHSQLYIRDFERVENTYLDRLISLLSQDLDFHSQDSGYASHNFHSFPAKFPPQLPRIFIEGLTVPGEIVLDPMTGSGTTILETYLLGRYGIGFDIDSLALMLSKAKVTPLELNVIAHACNKILKRAKISVNERYNELENSLNNRWDTKTRCFIDYWFAHETQVELLALINEIEQLDDPRLITFFKLAFSAIIITKTGGVSLALDLGHTRPHRAKVIIDGTGKVIYGKKLNDSSSRHNNLLLKTLRSPFKEFEKRVKQNLNGLLESDGIQPYLEGLFEPEPDRFEPFIALGNARRLPLKDDSVDLIVTSPPYASNAIDYMRAHKFSLVWLGYSIDDLGQKRKDYIGGEAVNEFDFENLPNKTSEIVADIGKKDRKKGRVLHRYLSEMTQTLREMYRVLRPGKAAIVVVGDSVMRGKNTETHTCLVEIGRQIGFLIPKIGVRNLDRDRRMMPAGSSPDLESQIQQRMHEEYVIGFYKPKA